MPHTFAAILLKLSTSSTMKQSIFLSAIVGLITSCSSNDRFDNSTSVDSTSRISASKLWLGTWERRQWGYSATLEIVDIKGDSIIFSLVAFNGAHGGEIEGKAIVKNGIATFHNNTEYDTCLIEFKLNKDTSIAIEQKKGICYAGMGVTYEGQYKNSKNLPEEEKEETLLSLGIFKTEKEDSLFRSLVGENYSLFVYSTQTTAEEEDLDSLNARVYSSGVTGLYRIQENIIMTDSLNNIWAAVLDREKVYYFTNNSKYKKTIPGTIDSWRKRFDAYPVIFK